jgi:hypothetical protein
MTTLKQQLQYIYDVASSLSQDTERYANEFQEIVNEASSALEESNMITQEMISKFSSSLNFLQSKLATAIQDAGE